MPHLLLYLLVAIESKKEVILDLNTKVKLTEAYKKDKLTVKEIVAKFNNRNNQMYDTLKAKIKWINQWLKNRHCSM
jgi:hypothetical protein